MKNSSKGGPPCTAAPESTNETNNINTGEKWRRILALLLSGKKYTRFDVEVYGDHCFNSSVSTIGKKGISISREPVVIDGRFGVFRCKRYWLEPEQIERARSLLGDSP